VRLAHRLLAVAIVLLLAGESSGLARAFGPGSSITCCCGPHSTARPCRCPDCPVSTRRTLHAAPPGDHLFADHGCDGAGADDPGVLTVLALPLTTPPATAGPRFAGVVATPALVIRSGRALEVDRPPP
jgi:hypothetical protein